MLSGDFDTCGNQSEDKPPSSTTPLFLMYTHSLSCDTNHQPIQLTGPIQPEEERGHYDQSFVQNGLPQVGRLSLSDLQFQQAGKIFDCIVVGSGPSGLGAAKELSKSNFQFRVLEARERSGGRLFRTKLGDAWIDHGAHWVHSYSENNPLYQIIQKDKLPILRQDLEVTVLDQLGYDQYDYQVGADWGQRLPIQAARHPQASSLSLREAAKTYIEYAKENLTSRQFNAFQLSINLIQGHQSGSIDQLSGYWTQHQQTGEGSDMILQGGYASFFQKQAQGIPIDYKRTVKEVDYSTSPVRVVCEDGTIYHARHVIGSFPLGVLKAGDVKFEPQLDQETRSAISKLGFGLLNKIVLHYKQRFWGSQSNLINLITVEDTPFYEFADNSQGESNVLVCLVAADKARNLSNLSQQQVIKRCHSALLNFYPDIQPPIQGKYIKWQNDPFVKGSYSFYAKGSSFQDPATIRKAKLGRLWLVGQHCSNEYIGCAHSAWQTGVRAGRQVIELITKA